MTYTERGGNDNIGPNKRTTRKELIKIVELQEGRLERMAQVIAEHHQMIGALRDMIGTLRDMIDAVAQSVDAVKDEKKLIVTN